MISKQRDNNQVAIRMPLPVKLAAIEACLDQDRALAAVVVDALTDYLTARGYLTPEGEPANQIWSRASESGV